MSPQLSACHMANVLVCENAGVELRAMVSLLIQYGCSETG